ACRVPAASAPGWVSAAAVAAGARRRRGPLALARPAAAGPDGGGPSRASPVREMRGGAQVLLGELAGGGAEAKAAHQASGVWRVPRRFAKAPPMRPREGRSQRLGRFAALGGGGDAGEDEPPFEVDGEGGIGPRAAAAGAAATGDVGDGAPLAGFEELLGSNVNWVAAKVDGEVHGEAAAQGARAETPGTQQEAKGRSPELHGDVVELLWDGATLPPLVEGPREGVEVPLEAEAADPEDDERGSSEGGGTRAGETGGEEECVDKGMLPLPWSCGGRVHGPSRRRPRPPPRAGDRRRAAEFIARRWREQMLHKLEGELGRGREERARPREERRPALPARARAARAAKRA
ncbi:unnamed protein product, partial [Prorocentrum cordatum]